MYALFQYNTMSRYSREPGDNKVYVGDLPRDAQEKEIERAFSYYGPLKNVWVARNPPGFAFVEYEDTRDADDSVRGLDGRLLQFVLHCFQYLLDHFCMKFFSSQFALQVS